MVKSKMNNDHIDQDIRKNLEVIKAISKARAKTKKVTVSTNKIGECIMTIELMRIRLLLKASLQNEKKVDVLLCFFDVVIQ